MTEIKDKICIQTWIFNLSITDKTSRQKKILLRIQKLDQFCAFCCLGSTTTEFNSF